jgi:putative phage-type endonuclease
VSLQTTSNADSLLTRRVAQHATEAWFAARRNGVSATAVANASTPAGFREEVLKALYPEEYQVQDNDYMKFGRDWEQWIVEKIPSEFGIVANDWLFHAEGHTWQLATPDGVSLDGETIAEVKTTGKEWKTIPLRYRRQVQWQLHVTGADRCVLAWLLRGVDEQGEFVPAWYEPMISVVERDEEMIAELIAIAERLQMECVHQTRLDEERENGTIQS